MMTSPVKAYIYAEDGSLLGHLVCNASPPEVLELDNRYFRHQGTSIEQIDETTRIRSFDYWETTPEPQFNIFEVCIDCGRVSSQVWWKCCPDHVTEQGVDVVCQVCVERLHPGDPEFERE